MTAVSNEPIPYPAVVDQRLAVDPVFKDFQRDGLVRVQLPYGEPCWLVTRYDHVRSVYGDRRFSRAVGFEHDVPRVWPIRVLARILGVPRDDGKRFQHWVETGTGVLTRPDARAEAQALLDAYVIELIAERRAVPQDDLLSDLVHATDHEDQLNEAELLGLITSLLAGGFETTAWQLGATAYALMDHPEHWRQLADDPDFASQCARGALALDTELQIRHELCALGLDRCGVEPWCARARR
jgi:cytochrome P450